MTVGIANLIVQATVIAVLFYFVTRFAPGLDAVVGLRTFIALWVIALTIGTAFRLGLMLPLGEWDSVLPRFLAMNIGLTVGAVLGWRARDD